MTVPGLQLAPGGPQVSRLVWGLWRLAGWHLCDAELLGLVHACLDLGITTFDLADIYGDYACEGIFGRALALEPGLRQRIQLVTKCGIKLVSDRRPSHRIKHYDTSQAHILASVEHSLRMLHTDHLDLLLIHRPDPLMDADEVAAAFDDLRGSGKVLHFGVSNFSPGQFDLLASRLDFPLVTNQVEISVLDMDLLHDGTVDQCQRLRIAPMAWSPLAGGRLFDGDDAQAVRVRQALAEAGEQLGGATLDQVALAWLLRHPARIVPIVGSGKIERLRRAAGAFEYQLSRQQWFTIWTASTGHEVP
ncbi:MAG: aldo/keto reductase family oxidoreductase [Anaerolineae bacterium]|jgi:predicted oxidoreductase